MCGITGLYLEKGTIDPIKLDGAAQTLTHRGPDNSDSFVDGSFGMAHTRLSIIDLSGGDQPLFARNKELILIANGEIYNFIELRRDLAKRGHHFATRSDSEVILHAYVQYGKDFLRVLHGMFAFALYDKTDRRLILARDRLGIKPLFLAHLAEGVAFASEIKALRYLDSAPPQIYPDGLIEYLQNQFSSGRTTLLQGYERLLPGEAVCIEQGRVRERWRYWSPLEIKPVAMDFQEARDAFDQLMETVMRQHMRSDVPFGLFLSGGVDSSILLALLSRYKDEPIRTFSVGFCDTRLADELPQAERLARRFGSRHTAIRRILTARSATSRRADDWCYVNNFQDPTKPRALRLPPGEGTVLRDDIGQLIDEAHTALTAAFESNEYHTRHHAIEEELQEYQENTFERLQAYARERNIKVIQTSTGVVFAPTRDDKTISSEEFKKLPKDEQERIDAMIREVTAGPSWLDPVASEN